MPLADDRIRDCLRSVVVGLFTPFDNDLEIQHDKLEADVKPPSGDGIPPFLAVADISKYHSLSQQERVDATETAVGALPDSACVLTGVGGSTKAATDLMGAYDRAGVDAVMATPPDHTYVHERGFIRYYEKLDAAIDTSPIPYVRGFDPSVLFLRDLSRTESAVGVEYAIEDPVKLGSTVAVADDDVVQMDGLVEPYAVSFWNEGIEGFSAGVSSFRLEIGFALFEALTEEDWERTREIHDLTLPFRVLRGETGTDNDLLGAISVSIVEKGPGLAGLHGGEVHEPIRSLSADDERCVGELYEELDDGIARVIDWFTDIDPSAHRRLRPYRYRLTTLTAPA